MSVIQTNKKFISYLIILFSFFIIFLVTLNQYENLQVNRDIKNNLDNELSLKNKKLEANNEIKKLLKDNPKITDKFVVDFSEGEIIEYIFDYAQDYNERNQNNEVLSKIDINDISLTEWSINDFGFMQSNVNLSVDIYNYQSMLDLLDFFVSPDSKYNFFIDNFNFPNEVIELWSFNINIPLKIYYN